MQNTSNIIELLKDTSFPQMLLIDGSWGSGKTHFIKNRLEDALKNEFVDHKLHYFSLYGVSSIDDFRDRLISLTFTSNPETSRFTQMATQVADSVATNLGERGIGGILNGAAGAYKYKLYADLNNCILLLDDLERISEVKTIKDILGECLNLAENKNIKIVVVANEQKLTCKDDIEKVFVDKVKFGYTSEEVALILRAEFQSELSDALYNELVLHINSTGSSNIRVLKRALIKFKKLKEVISQISGVSLEIALSNTLRQVIKICYAKFEVGYSSEEIKKSAETCMTRHFLNDKDGSSNVSTDREDELYRILGGDARHENLVDYCCEGVFRFENITTELQLPLEARIIDQIINDSLRHQLSDEDFQIGVVELHSLIHKKYELNLSEWFNACDTCIHLIENKYIESDFSRQEIIDICREIKIECFICEDIPNRQTWGNFYDAEVNELFSYKLTAIKENNKLTEGKEFSELFSVSWINLENEIYQKLSHTPFLQNIGSEKFIEAILNWSSNDIYRFAQYIKEKYNFNNIEDFLEPEYQVILDSIEGLLVLKLDPSLKQGAILQLKEALSEITVRMSKRLALKT